MKSRFLLLITLFVLGIFSFVCVVYINALFANKFNEYKANDNVYAASYWIMQSEMQRLLHLEISADDVRIVQSYPVFEPDADYVVNLNDNTCWVTSAFQGQVTRYGKGEPLAINNFGAPMALALDAERKVLWVADGALNQIVKMRLDGTFEKRIQISASPRSIASRADGGLWIATNRGLIVLDPKGNLIKELKHKAKYLSGVPGTNEVWLADTVNNHVMRLDGDGNILAEGRLKSLSGLIAVKDGGCFLLGRNTAFRLDADGALIGTLQGLDYSSRIVYQPVDESVWILKSRGSQLVQLPKEFHQKSLTAIVGLREDNIRFAPADGVSWIPIAEKPEEPPAPPETTEPPEKILPEEEEFPEKPQVEEEPAEITEVTQPEKIEIPEKEELIEEPEKPEEEQAPAPVETTEPSEKIEPEKEKPPTPEVEPFASLKGRPEKKELVEEPEKPEEEKPSTPPEKAEPPEKIEPEKEKTPVPEEKEESLEKLEEDKPPLTVDTTEPPEKTEPESKPTPQETPKPTVVPAPPTSTLLSEPPKFENGGVMLVELHEGLSSKRVLNVPQAMGRRYVWNFEDETYTLLLGLSVEAYNSYTNRARATWVEMLAEGVHTAKPIAEEFRKLADKKGWTVEQTANFTFAFVQCLPYTADDVATGADEFPYYAFETLVAGGGDCEDTTILSGSILLVLGYDVLALNPEGHLALGINGDFHGYYFEHNKRRYYYSETTGTGWKIGEIPEIYQDVPVILYEIPKQTQP